MLASHSTLSVFHKAQHPRSHMWASLTVTLRMLIRNPLYRVNTILLFIFFGSILLLNIGMYVAL